MNRPCPFGIRWSRGGPRSTRLWMIPVHDVVFLPNRDSGRVRNLVPDHHENQRPTATLSRANVLNGRGSRNRVAHMQVVAELEPAPSPHTTGQRHGRKKSAKLRVSIDTQFGLPMKRKEIQPVPERRQRIAMGER